MRRVTALVSAAAVVLAAAELFAQAKPNFAGTWVRRGASSGAAAAVAAVAAADVAAVVAAACSLRPRVTITQDAKALTIERRRRAAPQ